MIDIRNLVKIPECCTSEVRKIFINMGIRTIFGGKIFQMENTRKRKH